MIFALANLQCESASRHFQPEEGPSGGLLHDCEIFANLRLTIVSSSSHQAPERCHDHQQHWQLVPRQNCFQMQHQSAISMPCLLLSVDVDTYHTVDIHVDTLR